jgi:hypothetical protein
MRLIAQITKSDRKNFHDNLFLKIKHIVYIFVLVLPGIRSCGKPVFRSRKGIRNCGFPAAHVKMLSAVADFVFDTLKLKSAVADFIFDTLKLKSAAADFVFDTPNIKSATADDVLKCVAANPQLRTASGTQRDGIRSCGFRTAPCGMFSAAGGNVPRPPA